MTDFISHAQESRLKVPSTAFTLIELWRVESLPRLAKSGRTDGCMYVWIDVCMYVCYGWLMLVLNESMNNVTCKMGAG